MSNNRNATLSSLASSASLIYERLSNNAPGLTRSQSQPLPIQSNPMSSLASVSIPTQPVHSNVSTNYMSLFENENSDVKNFFASFEEGELNDVNSHASEEENLTTDSENTDSSEEKNERTEEKRQAEDELNFFGEFELNLQPTQNLRTFRPG